MEKPLQDNPLLDLSGLPRFAAIRPEHVAPAIERLLAEARAVRDRTNAAPPTWEAFVAPLEDANERLSRAWGQVAHLHAVMDSPPLREAYNASQPKVVQYWTELGQDSQRFEKYKALAASPEYARLSAARRKLVDDALRDFRLGGAELPAAQKPRFAAIQDELAALSTKFAENVLDATNAFSVVVEEQRTAGIPADVLAAALDERAKVDRAASEQQQRNEKQCEQDRDRSALAADEVAAVQVRQIAEIWAHCGLSNIARRLLRDCGAGSFAALQVVMNGRLTERNETWIRRDNHVLAFGLRSAENAVESEPP